MPSVRVGRIKKIEHKKKDIIISFVHFEPLKIHEDTYIEFYLYEGKEIDEKEYRQIVAQEAIYNAMQYAKKILAKKMYTEYEMRLRLQKKDIKYHEINKIITSLKEMGLINDEEYALNYIESRNKKNIGNNKIKQELKIKGIDIDKFHIDLSSNEETKAYQKGLLAWNKRKNLSHEKQKEGAIQELIRNGYSFNLALDTIKKIASNEENDDEEEKLLNEYVKIKTVTLDEEKIYKKLRNKGFKHEDIVKMMKGEKND